MNYHKYLFTIIFLNFKVDFVNFESTQDATAISISNIAVTRYSLKNLRESAPGIFLRRG